MPCPCSPCNCDKCLCKDTHQANIGAPAAEAPAAEAPTAEAGSQPPNGESFDLSTATSTQSSGIVGHNEDLDHHGDEASVPPTKPSNIPSCVHTVRLSTRSPLRLQRAQGPPSENSTGQEEDKIINELHREIGLLCGLGGVHPVARNGKGRLEFGRIEFPFREHGDYSQAIVSINDDQQTRAGILQNVLMAAKVLQDAGSCCDSFTFLVHHLNDWTSSLEKMHTSTVSEMLKGMMIYNDNNNNNNNTLERKRKLETGWEDKGGGSQKTSTESSIRNIMGRFGVKVREGAGTRDDPTEEASSFLNLSVQLLSLAFLSYAKSHDGGEGFSLPFLKQPLERVLLVGDPGQGFWGPRIEFSLRARLRCAGGDDRMIREPVFIFKYMEPGSPSSGVRIWRMTPAQWEQRWRRQRMDLLAAPVDLVDTFGSGDVSLLSHTPKLAQDDGRWLYAIKLRGGALTCCGSDSGRLHWTPWDRDLKELELPETLFEMDKKVRIV